MGRGKLCPYRHNQGEKMVVCKHCFLHQYDVTRMPECYFYSKFGDCNNKECPFLHVTPAFKTRDCPWYDQGFCKDDEAPVVGRPLCKQCHVRKIMCVNYLVGVCPKGPHCQFAHSLSTGHGAQHLLLLPGSLASPLPRWPACFPTLRGGLRSTGSPTTWGSGHRSRARATGWVAADRPCYCHMCGRGWWGGWGEQLQRVTPFRLGKNTLRCRTE
uniref:Cleavage and polyadenylation specificity factor subunit 4 n=1 Tax=Canis lupus dingo TaxID=286419 RepID=A0A8C0LBM1_CANLU